MSLTFCVSSAGRGPISKPLFSKTVFPKTLRALCQLSVPPGEVPSVEKTGDFSVSFHEARPPHRGLWDRPGCVTLCYQRKSAKSQFLLVCVPCPLGPEGAINTLQ